MPSAGWRGFSVIVVQCVSTTTCNTAIDFVNAANGATNLTLTKSFNARCSHWRQYQRQVVTSIPTQIAAALGNNWTGSVVVRSTNGTNLAVIAYSIRPANSLGWRHVGCHDSGRWHRDLPAGSLSEEHAERLLPDRLIGLDDLLVDPYPESRNCQRQRRRHLLLQPGRLAGPPGSQPANPGGQVVQPQHDA